eukprot:TRINITY_DN21216_c0_g1_i6.p2 TRINITY_DN21216_c0_g1~~TRINITY_DN21216_c0_g1_i6.p2  ORF type:complete len:236 (-),score=33.06 TRINITY_DN21216_c0_g1_i6:224-931(-)
MKSLDCPGVGLATHFLSHSQAESWNQTCIAMMIAICFRAKSAHCRFFIDYIAIRQLLKGDFKPMAVEEVITTIGRTAVVLEPPFAPVVLERAWCVFELSCTSRAGAEFIPLYGAGTSLFEICDDSKDEDDSSADALHQKFGDIFFKNPDVRLENCKAREAADKDMILEHIRAGVGLEALNSIVGNMFSPEETIKFFENTLVEETRRQESVERFRALRQILQKRLPTAAGSSPAEK